MTPERRYERKFDAGRGDARQLELWLRTNPGLLQPTFPPRDVLSLYYDDEQHTGYAQNRAGNEAREKVRLRHYRLGTARTGPLRLERKKKLGALSEKHVAVLGPEPLAPGAAPDLRGYTQISPELHALRPSLHVRYRRSYLRAVASGVRVTIDRDIWVGRPFSSGEVSLGHTIIEVKYAPDDEDLAEQIMSQFPFRLGRFSKYVEGMIAAHRGPG